MKIPSERHILYALCGLLITLLVWFARSKEYIVVDNSELIEGLVDRSQKHFERALQLEAEVKIYEIQQDEINELFNDSLVSINDSRASKDSILAAFKRRHGMFKQ